MCDICPSFDDLQYLFFGVLVFILFVGLVAMIFKLRNFALIWTSVMLNFLFFLYMSDPASPLRGPMFVIIAVFVWPVLNMALIFNVLNKKLGK